MPTSGVLHFKPFEARSLALEELKQQELVNVTDKCMRKKDLVNEISDFSLCSRFYLFQHTSTHTAHTSSCSARARLRAKLVARR